jgi:hypothetical protein
MSELVIKVISIYEGEGETWRVQSGENGEVLGISPDKEDAIEIGRRAAQEGGTLLMVVGRDGEVEWKEDYEWGQHLEELREAHPSANATIRVVSVVEGEDKRWLIEGDAAHEVLGSSLDKSDAIEAARNAAKQRHAFLIVHHENGAIEWTEDYACAVAEW